MDKSLKVGEDEWREREGGGNEFYASHEVFTLKSNFLNYQITIISKRNNNKYHVHTQLSINTTYT